MDEVVAMSLGHNSGKGIPVQTARIARASTPRGTPAMWVRDRLEGLFTDEDFADRYPTDGRRGLSPALVSVLQFAENLPDRQAAQAVRCRLSEYLPPRPQRPISHFQRLCQNQPPPS